MLEKKLWYATYLTPFASVILSPTRFAANICLTLEAAIIAGSVKENSCSNMLFLSVVMGEDDFQTQTWRFFQGLCVFDCKHKWKLWLNVTIEIEILNIYKIFFSLFTVFLTLPLKRDKYKPTTELYNWTSKQGSSKPKCVTPMGEHLQNHSHDFMIHKKYSLLEHESSWWKQPDPPLKTRVVVSLHVCSYVWSLTAPHIQPEIWMIKAIWHLYIEEKCGYNTSVRACFFRHEQSLSEN